MAQVDPLPLVPPTVITGQPGRAPSRPKTSATRSRPSAIALGCCFSMYSSQSESGRGTARILRFQAVTGPEDPGHDYQARGQESQDYREAGGDVDVGGAVEAPAEGADQVDHRIE